MKPIDDWKYEPNCGMGAKSATKSQNKAAAAGIRYHMKFYSMLKAEHKPKFPNDRLIIEPWFRNRSDRSMRSPDTVIINTEDNTGIVIEVKMNWKNGRDTKLIQEYLPIVKSAFDLDCVWPLLVTSNIRGYNHPPLIWNAAMSPLFDCLSWVPNDPTPVALYV